MKRRIGNLRGTPIIEGDKNLKNNNEIHISDLGGGSGSGESGDDGIWYISVEEANKIPSNGLKEMLYYSRVINKYVAIDDTIEIATYGYTGNSMGVKQEIATGILMTMPMKGNAMNSGTIVHTLQEYLEYLGYDLSGIKWMTKEQFYNLEA